jgi:hypothetical protein
LKTNAVRPRCKWPQPQGQSAAESSGALPIEYFILPFGKSLLARQLMMTTAELTTARLRGFLREALQARRPQG